VLCPLPDEIVLRSSAMVADPCPQLAWRGNVSAMHHSAGGGPGAAAEEAPGPPRPAAPRGAAVAGRPRRAGETDCMCSADDALFTRRIISRTGRVSSPLNCGRTPKGRCTPVGCCQRRMAEEDQPTYALRLAITFGAGGTVARREPGRRERQQRRRRRGEEPRRRHRRVGGAAAAGRAGGPRAAADQDLPAAGEAVALNGPLPAWMQTKSTVGQADTSSVVAHRCARSPSTFPSHIERFTIRLMHTSR